MKLGVVCCTFLRPHLLGELIDSFLRQTYPPALRQLIILDDMGQYAEQKGDGWRLVSHRNRYSSLGEKRNAATELPDSDCQGLVVADDDDIYLLQQYRQGNAQAADVLYERYVHRLEGLTRQNLTKRAQRRTGVDDIVQSVFRRFFASLDRGAYDVPRGEDLWSLLMVIALNRIRGEETHQRAGIRDIRRTVLLHDVPDGCVNDSLTAELRESTRLLLDDAISLLRPEEQQVVRLRLENFDVAEIALRISRSKRTTERLLQQAKSSLESLMQDEPQQ